MTSISSNQEKGTLSSGPSGDSDAASKRVASGKWAIGERIREARLVAGLDQYEVASRAGVSRSAVSAWELGQGISGEELVLLAKIVCVSAEWLITGEKDLDTRPGRAGAFDPEQLELLMIAAFELLGKPAGQSQELAKAILTAAERPQPDDQEPSDRAPKQRFGESRGRRYAP
jgi:transcriptional regulator with XRE-family HTH domain